MKALLCRALMAAIVGILASCASAPPQVPAPGPVPAGPTPAATPSAFDVGPLPAPLRRGRSQWSAVRWSELPGFALDDLGEAWGAWLRSCERAAPTWQSLCSDVRRLSIGEPQQQREWMMQRLQPYRVDSPAGGDTGLLTGYYEPMMEASRIQRPGFGTPLYRLPAGLGSGQTWYTRQDIDMLSAARAALKGREIAWLANPVDALVLHIQGSGRLLITEPDGSRKTVRLAFAGSNGQPYRSVGRWLIDQGALRDASWPAIKSWMAQNPARVNELLWSNPRYVFFREEALATQDSSLGPRGAQGVPLTPGRSIAVDPESIPYGTPVWLASSGPATKLQRLVLAQDTGSAITGAVRADYFAGWGDAAADLAGRLKQSLSLWVLWPR